MPLKYIDPDGRRLFLAGSNLGQAMADILSLVNNAKFKGKVTINFVESDKAAREVEVDFGSVDVESSKGLSLLLDLTSSKNNYLYEVHGTASEWEREPYEIHGKMESTRYGLAQSARAKHKSALNFSTTAREDGDQ